MCCPTCDSPSQPARRLGLARALVLEAIATHFGETPHDIATIVQRVEDRETLHALLRQAITCPTLEAFREALHTQS